MAIELLLNFIMSFGRAEAINILNLASKNWVKRYKKSHKWKKLIVETGEFFIKNEQYANLFFKDLELTLSKKNLSKIANDLKKEDGYNLKSKLFNSLMKLMEKYEIPN